MAFNVEDPKEIAKLIALADANLEARIKQFEESVTRIVKMLDGATVTINLPK